MSGMTRCFFRWGLIGGLALGGLTLLVGPERVATGLAQIRTSAQGVVDQVVDDPVALRRQLEKLAEEYPDRIAEVRGEIAEGIAKAKDELPAAGSRGVFIRFEGVRYDVDEAYTEAMRIGEVRKNYRDRLAMDREQAKMLEEQKTRLHQILSKLEDDFGTYQAQLWALDRQIDAIQRNDRLIELMEQQEKTLASYNKYEKVSNLKQLQGKLAELREIQKAQLETLSKRTFRDDYESRAKMDFENEDEVDVFEDIFEEDTTDEKTTAGSVAWAPPIVIE
ncbi:MAG: hypothetical protein ACYTGC_20000 [Planctomycetota bacterium]|jgi:chromosome segregation ATPase